MRPAWTWWDFSADPNLRQLRADCDRWGLGAGQSSAEVEALLGPPTLRFEARGVKWGASRYLFYSREGADLQLRFDTATDPAGRLESVARY